MKRAMTNAARALVMLAAIVTLAPTVAHIAEIADTATRQVPTKAPPAPGDDSDKKAKHTPFVKRMFKDFRPAQCKSQDRGAPNTSWPVRGDAAVSFCR
jgi:hypothetical protein